MNLKDEKVKVTKRKGVVIAPVTTSVTSRRNLRGTVAGLAYVGHMCRDVKVIL